MAAKHGANAESSKAAGAPKALGMPVVAVAVVIALVVGVLLGHFVLGGSGLSAAFAGKTSVAEGDLDQVIATYSYKGKTESVTVRDAIESQTSLDAVKDDDGNYTLPNADSALAVARNKILEQVAADEGITVSDDELSSYAEQILGVSDISQIASQYGLSEDQAKEVIRQSAMMYKLKDKVCSSDTPTAPTAPDAPADNDQDSANATYGAYIVGLLGDEWDSANNTWARTDGEYYNALKDESWTPDAATYAQAQMAYSVAYQKYAQASQTTSSEWTNYVNGILTGASIQIATLGA